MCYLLSKNLWLSDTAGVNLGTHTKRRVTATQNMTRCSSMHSVTSLATSIPALANSNMPERRDGLWNTFQEESYKCHWFISGNMAK